MDKPRISEPDSNAHAPFGYSRTVRYVYEGITVEEVTAALTEYSATHNHNVSDADHPHCIYAYAEANNISNVLVRVIITHTDIPYNYLYRYRNVPRRVLASLTTQAESRNNGHLVPPEQTNALVLAWGHHNGIDVHSRRLNEDDLIRERRRERRSNRQRRQVESQRSLREMRRDSNTSSYNAMTRLYDNMSRNHDRNRDVEIASRNLTRRRNHGRIYP